jgi:hypothetical protein
MSVLIQHDSQIFQFFKKKNLSFLSELWTIDVPGKKPEGYKITINLDPFDGAKPRQ